MYIRFADGSGKGVPAWMFDPAVCASIRSAETPTVNCAALLRLAQLLESAQSEILPESGNVEHEPTISEEEDGDGTAGKA